MLHAHFVRRDTAGGRTDGFTARWAETGGGGNWERAVRTAQPQHMIYPPVLSAELLRVRQYFHIVSLNTMGPYLLPSP